MKCAIYARISTDESHQCIDNQVIQIRNFIDHRGWQVVAEYTENASGTLGARSRPILAQMFADAHRGKFQAVVVFALDRLTRMGIKDAFAYIERLSDSNVEFYSVTEPQFTTAGPAGDLMVAISAWMAKQEREQLIKRIRAGQDRARARGQKFGRKPLVFDSQRAKDLRGEGKSLREIGKIMGVSQNTVLRKLNGFRELGPRLVLRKKRDRESFEQWHDKATGTS